MVNYIYSSLGTVVHDNEVDVVEYTNNRISVSQLDGQFSHIIGSGFLSNPYYTAVSPRISF